MDLSDNSLSPDLESLDTVPSVFGSTLKSFDLEALNLKRGFRVNQALKGLRPLGQLIRELETRSSGSYAAISYRPDK
jgi:hypothetical protein